MQQKQNMSTVIKGLAFPIGYFVFMNIFQSAALGIYAVFCFLRDLIIPVASAANDIPHFFELLADCLVSPAFERYLNETLIMDLAGTPTYAISVLTSILALVILWFVFNRKKRDFKDYFGFRPAPVRSIISAVLLGLGFYFLVNAVLTLISIISNYALTEWLLPTLRDMTEQLMQAGERDLASSMRELVDVIESTLFAPTPFFSLGWFTLAAIVFAPLIEEMIFRAGAISNMRKKLPMVVTILLSSLLFSLAHIGSLNVSQLIYTFILGVTVALLYVLSDSIYPAIVCHFCFNGANLVSLTLYKLFSLDYIDMTPQGNYFYGYSDFIHPGVDKLLSWYDVLSIGFTLVTALLSIPMLIVGIILLLSMRKKKKTADADVPDEAPGESPETAPQPTDAQPAPLANDAPANDPFEGI